MKYHLYLGAAAGLGIIVSLASPVQSGQSVDQKTLQQIFLQNVQSGTTKQHYDHALRLAFISADADGDGEITSRDVELHKSYEEAKLRSEAVQQVSKYDLDGDGFVTEDEIRRGMWYELRFQLKAISETSIIDSSPWLRDALTKQVETKVSKILSFDSDQDGRVPPSEVAKSVKPATEDGTMFGRTQRLFSLNLASSGTLTLKDYEALGGELFRQVDTDGDGVISPQEMTDYRTRMERVGCEMPKVSEKAKLVLLSSYGTETLSDVTLGGQNNIIGTGRIDVESGADKIYVVITSSRPAIWQFTGATKRVENVVVTSSDTASGDSHSSRTPLAGVTGVDRERVKFFNRPDCLSPFSESPSAGSFQTVSFIRAATGRTPDVTAAIYGVGSFSVPSGVATSLRNKTGENIVGAKKDIENAPPSQAKTELFWYSPGGVAEIDPSSVVSSVPASKYKVLPEQAGLVQLLASGALQTTKGGEYIIREKTSFPAGLAGGHSVTFLLPTGVPFPEGDPGHSCVVIEETGLKKGPACR